MRLGKISYPTLAPSSRAGLTTSRHLQDATVDRVSESTPNPPLDSNLLQNALLSTSEEDTEPRLPRSVQAVYLKPLRRHAQYGVPACDLQLRSYSVRNVEFFADFALRAAYYLNLPATGPTPLPKITERWTVPRSNFVHKKSQENFERITLRRLIQIQDGHPETVQVWLAFIKKHSFYGIGMKANVWEHDKLGLETRITSLKVLVLKLAIGLGKNMEGSLQDLEHVVEPGWAHFGRKKNLDLSESAMGMLGSTRFSNVTNGDAPLGETRASGL